MILSILYIVEGVKSVREIFGNGRITLSIQMSTPSKDSGQ